MIGPIGQDDSHICTQAPRQHTHLQGVGRTKNFEQIWVWWEIGEIDITLAQTFRLQMRQAGRVNEAKGNQCVALRGVTIHIAVLQLQISRGRQQVRFSQELQQIRRIPMTGAGGGAMRRWGKKECCNPK